MMKELKTMTLLRMAVYAMVLAGIVVLPARAEDKIKIEAVKPTPITQWIEAENKLLDTLGRPNQETFFIFRNKHSVIRSIRIVHRDIKNAVKACGTANKELKAPMNTRFKDWGNAVLPILKDAEKFLAMELKEQESFHAGDYKHVIKLNDKAYKFSESKVQKTPVTSVEACEGLLKSMDSTEDKLVDLLQDILLPEEVVRERIEQAKKAEKKAKEKAEKKAKEKAKEKSKK